jgi:hypothetical protein
MNWSYNITASNVNVICRRMDFSNKNNVLMTTHETKGKNGFEELLKSGRSFFQNGEADPVDCPNAYERVYIRAGTTPLLLVTKYVDTRGHILTKKTLNIRWYRKLKLLMFSKAGSTQCNRTKRIG